MNLVLKTILLFLIDKKYIGGKHIPEDKLIKSKTKWIDTKAKKEFEKEYKRMLNDSFILRLKKRTGKGSNWHISLNPRKLKELYEILSWADLKWKI